MLRLVKEDCFKFLATLPDESVDLAIIDPPYFEIIDEKWDNQWANENDYLDWCRKWTMEADRVLKPGGCIYVWGTTKTDTFLRYKLEVINKVPGFHYQNWLIWAYDWGGRTKKTFPRKHEDVLMYSKGKNFLFNADEVRVPYKMPKNIRQGAANNPLGKIPTDVWTKNNHTTSKEYVGWHPTQKPIELLERIIKANTNQGDTILDFFSGTASTLIAAANTKRSFVGCESDPVYHQLSLQRVANLIGPVQIVTV